MIEEPGCVAGSLSSKIPHRGPEPKQPNVVGDLGERNGDRFQLAVGFDERILGRLRFGMIGRFGELRPQLAATASRTPWPQTPDAC